VVFRSAQNVWRKTWNSFPVMESPGFARTVMRGTLFDGQQPVNGLLPKSYAGCQAGTRHLFWFKSKLMIS
jgi:hypothetical protein